MWASRQLADRAALLCLHQQPVSPSHYCSSVIELGGSATKAASLSFGMGKRVWPFTLDSGLPINCAA